MKDLFNQLSSVSVKERNAEKAFPWQRKAEKAFLGGRSLYNRTERPVSSLGKKSVYLRARKALTA
jgi:hypothetical protein